MLTALQLIVAAGEDASVTVPLTFLTFTAVCWGYFMCCARSGASALRWRLSPFFPVYAVAGRDRLDRAVTAAVRLTRDQERSMPMTDEDRRALADLIDQGRSILREYGSSQFDDAYQPCSIDMQDDLTERLNRLVDGDPANVFDHCDRMLDQLDDVFERGKDGR